MLSEQNPARRLLSKDDLPTKIFFWVLQSYSALRALKAALQGRTCHKRRRRQIEQTNILTQDSS